MSDDKNQTRPQDARRISLQEPYEVRGWTESLGCTEQELREAVQAVGHSAIAVREFLAARRSAATSG
jgi:hypothetical protein